MPYAGAGSALPWADPAPLACSRLRARLQMKRQNRATTMMNSVAAKYALLGIVVCIWKPHVSRIRSSLSGMPLSLFFSKKHTKKAGLFVCSFLHPHVCKGNTTRQGSSFRKMPNGIPGHNLTLEKGKARRLTPDVSRLPDKNDFFVRISGNLLPLWPNGRTMGGPSQPFGTFALNPYGCGGRSALADQGAHRIKEEGVV